MSDETKIFTKNDKNGDKCASGGQESGLKLIFERGVAILVRPWRFPGQPKKFVFFSIKVGTINSGTSLDSREQFKKTGKLEMMMKLLLFFPLIFLVSASSAALEIKHLVLPEKPTKWEEKAAGEFAAYFRKINKRPLKQYTAGDSRIPKTGGLYLGNAAEEKLAVSQAESGQLKAGGYLLKIRTGNAGITGAHSGGILYGVCALLEIGGVKVYGEECEVLPRKLLFPDTLFKVSNPAFLLRVLEPVLCRADDCGPAGIYGAVS